MPDTLSQIHRLDPDLRDHLPADASAFSFAFSLMVSFLGGKNK
jgi:hypothetical protein